MKIYIAGINGFVGKNLYKYFTEKTSYVIVNKKKNPNFLIQTEVVEEFDELRPDLVIISAGKVGGILANKSYPAQFIYENIMIWTNLIKTSLDYNVKKLIFLGSSTIYSQESICPIKEESLLEGKLEKNVEPYAIAKISAIKLCEEYYRRYSANFLSLTLTNLYGPYDHFNTENAHVIPSLISKFHKAKMNKDRFVELWGTGTPTRDFLFVDELAKAISFIIDNINAINIYEKGVCHLNIGSGRETSIKEASKLIADTVGFDGEIKFDSSKPDGTKKKVLDISRIKALGWEPQTELKIGIQKTYNWYKQNFI